MRQKNQSMDMLHGPLNKKLILFALPIAFSSMLQQLFNAADTSVVGHFSNTDALAAVGTNGEIIALLVTLSSGLAIGANVRIAKCIGEGKISEIPNIIHTAICFALIAGCAGGILGQFFAKPLLTAIQTPDTVLSAATQYLCIYFIGYPFLLLYDFGSAILRAKGDSKRPFFALTISGIVNVMLNLLFVIYFQMGVVGVAIATDLANVLAAGIVLYWLRQDAEAFQLRFRSLKIRRTEIFSILAIGIPAAIQGAVFCFANIFVQAAVNQFGAIATAGSTIAMNFEYFGYFMITAFGQTATTFVSQNFFANQKVRCQKIVRRCLVFSILSSAMITVPLTLWREPFSMIFSTDPKVIQAASLRILLILSLEPICSCYEVPAGALRGAGHSVLPALLTVLGTCALRIVWIFTVFTRIHTQEILFVVFPISWVITILLIWAGWMNRRPWKSHR